MTKKAAYTHVTHRARTSDGHEYTLTIGSALEFAKSQALVLSGRPKGAKMQAYAEVEVEILDELLAVAANRPLMSMMQLILNRYNERVHFLTFIVDGDNPVSDRVVHEVQIWLHYSKMFSAWIDWSPPTPTVKEQFVDLTKNAVASIRSTIFRRKK